MQKRYQIFVSSTFDDLKEERRKVWETLVQFNYIVTGMETFPATNESQFSYIRKQISESDFYIVIIGSRYGSTAEDGISFTEKEYNFACDQKLPVFVFPIEDPEDVAVSKTDKDPQKAEQLKIFRARAMKDRIAFKWNTSDKLCLGIIKTLQTATETEPRSGWVRGDSIPSDAQISEVLKLREENERLKVLNKQVGNYALDKQTGMCDIVGNIGARKCLSILPIQSLMTKLKLGNISKLFAGRMARFAHIAASSILPIRSLAKLPAMAFIAAVSA